MVACFILRHSPKTRNPYFNAYEALARHLQRARVVHDLADSEEHGDACQQELRPIGEESSGRYAYIPAQLLVVEDVCKKYACDCPPAGPGDRG